MKKVAVVYWSATGNTEAMAENVCAGAKSAGADVTLLTASEFDGSRLGDFDAAAFGCPAMGAEELESETFAPLFDDCRPALAGKRIGRFGSYGWGDGEWMRNWEADCIAAGAVLAADSVITQEAPDEAALNSCRALGAALAA